MTWESSAFTRCPYCGGHCGHTCGGYVEPSRNVFAMSYQDMLVRASGIWAGLSDRAKAALDREWQEGYRAFGIQGPYSNPYVLQTDAWKWAAWQMGWETADRSNQ